MVLQQKDENREERIEKDQKIRSYSSDGRAYDCNPAFRVQSLPLPSRSWWSLVTWYIQSIHMLYWTWGCIPTLNRAGSYQMVHGIIVTTMLLWMVMAQYNVICNMCSDDRNIYHRRWSERCLLTKGDNIEKRDRKGESP